VEKYCRARQATGDKMMHAHSCWITKATNTHSEYVILISFPLQPECCDIGTLPVLCVFGAVGTAVHDILSFLSSFMLQVIWFVTLAGIPS